MEGVWGGDGDGGGEGRGDNGGGRGGLIRGGLRCEDLFLVLSR